MATHAAECHRLVPCTIADGIDTPTVITGSKDPLGDHAGDHPLHCLEPRRPIGSSLDFVIPFIAFAPRDDLHGRVVDCSAEGFIQAIRIS